VNFTVSPPVTFTYFVFGEIAIVRVAADTGAGSPNRSGRGGESSEAHAADSMTVNAIVKSNFEFMAHLK
jgi:hypothetical protein